MDKKQSGTRHTYMHIPPHMHIYSHTWKIYTKICDILLARKTFDLQFLIYLAAPPAMPAPTLSPFLFHSPTCFCFCSWYHSLSYSAVAPPSVCQSIAQFFALSRALAKQPQATFPRLVCVRAAPAACIPNDVAR